MHSESFGSTRSRQRTRFLDDGHRRRSSVAMWLTDFRTRRRRTGRRMSAAGQMPGRAGEVLRPAGRRATAPLPRRDHRRCRGGAATAATTTRSSASTTSTVPDGQTTSRPTVPTSYPKRRPDDAGTRRKANWLPRLTARRCIRSLGEAIWTAVDRRRSSPRRDLSTGGCYALSIGWLAGCGSLRQCSPRWPCARSSALAQDAPPRHRHQYSPYPEEDYPNRVFSVTPICTPATRRTPHDRRHPRARGGLSLRPRRDGHVEHGVEARLNRPLDFLVISDHAENLGLAPAIADLTGTAKTSGRMQHDL